MGKDNNNGIPELNKNEKRIIEEMINDLSENIFEYKTGDQLFSLFTRFQVVPEKQLKMMFNLAYELSEQSEACSGPISDQYLRLSTLATIAVQEKFGQRQEGESSRKGRTAKANAKINMQSYFDDVEPILFKDSDDEQPKKKKKDKVEWSDSELKETEPQSAADATPVSQEVGTTDDGPTDAANLGEEANSDDQSISISATRSATNQTRKRVFDVVCIDSSSEDEQQEKSADATEPELPEPASVAPSVQTQLEEMKKTKQKPVVKKSKRGGPKPGNNKKKQVKKIKALALSADSVSDLLKECEGSKENVQSPKDQDTPKPVGVVKATPRTTPEDSKKSTDNSILQDESLILNFKKGHYPTFQTSYTHLVVVKKENKDLYTDSAPTVKEILAMDGEVVPGSDLKSYSLKQFIHNRSGQYLIGESGESHFFIVPGLINKSKDKV